MIVLVAEINAKKGNEDQLKEKLNSMIEKVQDEKGTLAYILHQGREEKGKFVFYEEYRDQEALDFHLNTSYLKNLLGEIGPLLSEEPKIDLYNKVNMIKR